MLSLYKLEMNSLLLLLIVVICIGLCHGSILKKERESINCYDCNYSPSGDVRRQYGWISSEEAGYRKCSLDTKEDSQKVDKISCNSGICFIRMDQNGLLYRGCADYNYLPWTVDVRLQCQYQGPFYSLWWFCNSTLCNDGLLDNRDRCGYYDRSQHVQQLSDAGGPEHSVDRSGDKETAATWKGKEAVVDKANRPETYVRSQKPEVDVPKPLPPINLSPAQQEAQHEAAKQASENPCDGTCRDNTSGLFAHPNVTNYFIHCGHGNINGRRCYCCQPFVVMCPLGTVFDDKYKICRRGAY